MRDEVSDMCNLSQGIVEQTTEEVTKKVTKEVTKEVTAEFIISMKENGFALEQIALVAKMSEEQVQKILDTHQPVLA
jgi:DNA-binding transcriptional regulator YhcF (GntR family)